MTPTPPRQEALADQIGEVLTRLPPGYSLVPSQIYHFFIMDSAGHNEGYLTDGGEVQWWASARSEPSE